MPLHDWSNDELWEDLHSYFIIRLADHIRPQLPAKYVLRLGSLPRLNVGGRPDVSVRTVNGGAPHTAPTLAPAVQIEPDAELAVGTIEPGRSIFVQKGAALVAVVEVVSPRNKDRPAARESYTSRYAGYLLGGANLLLIDLLPAPAGYSFPDDIAAAIDVPDQPPLPAPNAVAYRVGEPAATGGTMVAVWRRALAVGQPLPTLPLPLTVHESVAVDLESTYMAAANALPFLP